MKADRLLKQAALLALAFSLQPSAFLSADPLGTAFSYQGKLTDGGQPANGRYDLEFTLYDAATNGKHVAGPLIVSPVGVANGLFAVELDFGPAVFTGDARWLEIAVRTNGGGAFAPFPARQLLTPAPYALYAPLAGSAATVSGGSVTAQGLSTPVPPAAGQVLTFNGATLAWHDPGAVGSAWLLGGNASTAPGTHFLGTTDGQPLELKVNGLRALRLEPTTNGAPNVIGGHALNRVSPGVSSATIGGGGGAASPHWVSSDGGTVGGGAENQALGLVATVSGGQANVAGGPGATIGGGAGNRIATGADFATIPGGVLNSVAAPYGFATGRRAKANHSGAFVWADATDADFASTSSNQFLVRASDGVGLGTTTPQAQLHVAGDTVVGGTNFTAPGHTARLILGDVNHVIRSVYGGGVRIDTWPDPDALVLQDNTAMSVSARSIRRRSSTWRAPCARRRSRGMARG